jgi:hypothetical protein
VKADTASPTKLVESYASTTQKFPATDREAAAVGMGALVIVDRRLRKERSGLVMLSV